MPRRKEEGSNGEEGPTFNIYGGTQIFNLAATETPRGLVPVKPVSSEKKLPGKTFELKTRKLNLSPRENQVLDVLILQTFQNETTGVGEAEHSFEFENQFIPTLPGGGKVEKDDYIEVIQSIKKRSKEMDPPLKPSDVARSIIRGFEPVRTRSVTSPEYLKALGILTAAIQEYWDPPKKSPNPRKR